MNGEEIPGRHSRAEAVASVVTVASMLVLIAASILPMPRSWELAKDVLGGLGAVGFLFSFPAVEAWKSARERLEARKAQRSAADVRLFANEAGLHGTGDENEVTAVSESVVVTLRRHGDKVTAEVEAPTGDLTLRRGPGPTSTGDVSFERLVSASGEAASLARLDKEARALAIPLVAVAMRLSEGRAVLTWASPSRTRALVDLMERLSRPRTLTESATENVRADPVPGVRLMSLAALLAQRGKIQEAEAAIQIALQDSDQSVRLLAALAMPSKRSAVLETNPPRLVAAMLTQMPPPCAAMAIRYLGACGPEAEPHLLAALEVPELVGVHVTQSALLDALRAAGTAASIEALKRHGLVIAAKGIQERLPNAGPGQVSIADADDAGSLSMADPQGALSLPPKKQTT